MFIEKLSEKFNKDEPIFTEEIIELFQEYSRAQVFRYINKAKENEEIIQFSKGVYFYSERNVLGRAVNDNGRFRNREKVFKECRRNVRRVRRNQTFE